MTIIIAKICKISGGKFKDIDINIFSLPGKEGGVNSLLPEGKVYDYQRSIQLCEPLYESSH